MGRELVDNAQKVIHEDRLYREILRQIGNRPGQAANILRLSEWLGADRRERPSGYMNRPEAVAAYLQYYFPRQAALYAGLVEQLIQESVLKKAQVYDVLDLGAGPLSASVGVARRLQIGTLDAVDISMAMMQRGKRIMEHINPAWVGSLKLHKQKIEHLNLNKTYDLILVGHVLNELNVRRFDGAARLEWLGALSKYLKPSGIIIVTEPATTQASRAQQRLRNMVHQRSPLDVLWPCPDIPDCPLLIDKRDWCFQQFKWKSGGDLLQLRKRLPFRDDILKVSAFVFGKVQNGSRTRPRVVGDMMRFQGGEGRYICSEDGLVELFRRPRLPNRLGRLLRGEFISASDYAMFE